MEGGSLPMKAIWKKTATTFEWKIENFSRLKATEHPSNVVDIGGYKWKLVIFPKGNNVDCLSVFLHHVYLDAGDIDIWPYADIILAIFDQTHGNCTQMAVQHQFRAGDGGWGFMSFMPLSDLHDHNRGYLLNDTCVLLTRIIVYKMLPPPSSLSKLLNQTTGSNGDRMQNHCNHTQLPQQIVSGTANHTPKQKSEALGGTEQFSKLDTTLMEIDAIISAIVGLDGVKLQLRKWIKGLVLHHKRKSLGLKVGTRKALHMVFLGNPGTGKTMVAQLLAKILHKLGLASTDKITEVQRTDLVAQYIGQTGAKTRLKIKEASGGILFVDEAYRLIPADIPNDFGIEALEEIMSAMDSGEIITIFAGYKEQMERVMRANAGFSRRVSKFLYFDDYTPRDIAMILHSKVNTQKEDSVTYGFKLHVDCTVKDIASLIKEHVSDQQLKKFNGGLVEPLLINSLESMDLRLDVNCMDANMLTTITMKDLEEALKSFSKREKKPRLSYYL